ncbi:MAG: hypothetical protein CMJ89_09175 [Planctomycetes bacterium]|jgi:hypothetical protein|nr:hypothetical protein [Planctomycetota bacterium]
MNNRSIFAFVLLLPLACASPGASRETFPAGEHFGEPMEMGQHGDVVNFAVVDASPSDYFERTLLVKATVTAVCVNKGCWMQVEDEGHKAMVRWETGCGGKYAFPKEAIGQRVLIQGSFYPKEISEEDAAHLEEDSGQPIEIDREGYEFNASAILVMKPAHG